MPLGKCIKDSNGDIWCYEIETNSVCKIILEKPIATTIPQEVLLALLKVVSEKSE